MVERTPVRPPRRARRQSGGGQMAEETGNGHDLFSGFPNRLKRRFVSNGDFFDFEEDAKSQRPLLATRGLSSNLEMNRNLSHLALQTPIFTPLFGQHSSASKLSNSWRSIRPVTSGQTPQQKRPEVAKPEVRVRSSGDHCFDDHFRQYLCPKRPEVEEKEAEVEKRAVLKKRRGEKVKSRTPQPMSGQNRKSSLPTDIPEVTWDREHVAKLSHEARCGEKRAWPVRGEGGGGEWTLTFVVVFMNLILVLIVYLLLN